MSLRIKALRKAANLTQQDLSHMAAISRPLLAQIESGARPANTSRLAAIAKPLGVPVAELFGGTPEEPWAEEMVDLLRQLSLEDGGVLLRVARALVSGGPR